MPRGQISNLDRFGNAWKRTLHAIANKVARREDVDRTLSYYTRQQVVFFDWRLGCIFWAIQASMALLVIGYSLVYKEGYLDRELAQGAVVTHVTGDAVSTSTGKPATRYFSTEELTYPGLENGNVFIATRQTVYRQMRGVCEDAEMPCVSNDDCITAYGQGTCSANGLCLVRSWCNVEEEPEKYVIAVDTVQVWVRAFIQFVGLAPEKIFTTDVNNSVPTAANTFSVRHLLTMVDPVPVHYEEVAELGGLFEVAIRWECNVQSQAACVPEASIRRLDVLFDPDNIGYSFSYTEYLDDNHRLKYDTTGIRFLFRTSGVGKKMSIAATITVLSTSGTLASLAVIVADLLLTKVFKDRQKFKARKFEKTPDFSDYLVKRETRQKEAGKLIDVETAEQETQEKEAFWMQRLDEEV